MAGSREWRAVYRLQLGPALGFRAARDVVLPYARRLGVSHLYLSPSLQARRGSTHGYDVVDPTRVSDELGGEDELRALAAADDEVGILLDIVPNHMAASEEENPYWADPERRLRFFDVDPETGWHRRFFTIGELAGVRVEDTAVFEETHRKVLELLADGVVDGLRVDHPDGLVDPAGYLERLRDAGAEHVWVEKILEPGEELRDWATEGTTGYEFANDVTALFVDRGAEDAFTQLYAELTGERRAFAEIAAEAKLEQAREGFRPETDVLRRLWPDVPALEESLASLHVYRTYVEPWSGKVAEADREAVREARLPRELARVLLLEERGRDEFVARFQQTTGPVMAKGVEDTAFYRYHRLVALNEVGGDPGRFGVSVEAFHEASRRRAERFPRQLLTTLTHDTKRSGDVRARLCALTWLPEEWAEAVARWEGLAGRLDDPGEGYLLWQTLVGAWPIEAERVEAYMEKAMREAGTTTSWLQPNEGHEREVRAFVRRLYEHERFPADFEPFVRRVAGEGRRIALGMTLLKLTSPGVPDLYQGDALESRSLVDPDNRRPIDWDAQMAALADPPPKMRAITAALELRRRLPHAFGESYEPVDAGPDVCAFRRGEGILVVVPVRPGASKAIPEAAELEDLLPELAVGLFAPPAVL